MSYNPMIILLVVKHSWWKVGCFNGESHIIYIYIYVYIYSIRIVMGHHLSNVHLDIFCCHLIISLSLIVRQHN